MESNEQLTSYLKSMFVQYNGEQQSPPPPVASSRPSKSPESESKSESDNMTGVESQSDEQVDSIANAKLVDASTDVIETDINNNEHSVASPSTANGSSTIEVDVDVHHSTNDDLHEDVDKREAEEPTVEDAPVQRSSLGHNRIALTFLDELKQTLQGNEIPAEPTTVTSVVEVHSPAEATENSSTLAGSEDESPVKSEPVVQSNSSEDSTALTKSPLVNGNGAAPSPGQSSVSSASSVQDEESASANESGIQEDIDDQSSTASQLSPTLEASADTSYRLGRSVSTDSSSSNGSTSRRVILRSVSQDVKFKLESIKEEKKVTKSHVSQLANFWKSKSVIAPKESHP